MSDPVSSRDVEDVLSSIRRLVSEEAKGNGTTEGQTIAPDIHEEAENAAETALAEIVQQVTGEPPSNDETPVAPVDSDTPAVSFRHQAASAARRAAADGGDKLVLTADFRISDGGDSRDTESDEAQTSADAPDPEQGESAGVLHLHAVRETGDSVEPAAEAVTDAAESPDDPSDADTTAAEPPRPAPFTLASEDTLFERARQAMSGGSVDSLNPADEQAPFAPVEADTPDEADQATLAGPEASAEPAPQETDSDPGPEPVAETLQQGASPFSETRRFADTPSESETEAGDEAAIDEDAPERINFVEEEESILDEDTLRDMVSEMVRQELQGELGDRITRNVRKLVRREIQRALASRAFE